MPKIGRPNYTCFGHYGRIYTGHLRQQSGLSEQIEATINNPKTIQRRIGEKMAQLFDETRHYQPTDPEILALLGSTTKQAQMRHYGRSPTFYRLGRKIIYHGSDLNLWAEAQKIESGGGIA